MTVSDPNVVYVQPSEHPTDLSPKLSWLSPKGLENKLLDAPPANTKAKAPFAAMNALAECATLTAMGAAGLINGLTMLVGSATRSPRDREVDSDTWNILGVVSLGAGVALTGVGIPLTVAGAATLGSTRVEGAFPSILGPEHDPLRKCTHTSVL